MPTGIAAVVTAALLAAAVWAGHRIANVLKARGAPWVLCALAALAVGFVVVFGVIGLLAMLTGVVDAFTS